MIWKLGSLDWRFRSIGSVSGSIHCTENSFYRHPRSAKKAMESGRSTSNRRARLTFEPTSLSLDRDPNAFPVCLTSSEPIPAMELRSVGR
jgi:hypothetical protein